MQNSTGNRNTTRCIARAVTALLLACVTPALWAHHSAAQFDLDSPNSSITGIVRVFKVANPHTTIVLEVSDDNGTREIEFEGHSRNNYYRAGWRPNMVKVGDRITLGYAARKDGGDGGYVRQVTTASGESF